MELKNIKNALQIYGLVWGGHRVSIFEFYELEGVFHIRAVTYLPPYNDWILDCLIFKENSKLTQNLSNQGSQKKEIGNHDKFYFSVALASNVVDIFQFDNQSTSEFAFSLKIACKSEHALLYSMRLFEFQNDLVVASGTIWNRILIWSVFQNPGFVFLELNAHTGSIFRLDWSPDGKHVCSASDDRRFVGLFEKKFC